MIGGALRIVRRVEKRFEPLNSIWGRKNRCGCRKNKCRDYSCKMPYGRLTYKINNHACCTNNNCSTQIRLKNYKTKYGKRGQKKNNENVREFKFEIFKFCNHQA